MKTNLFQKTLAAASFAAMLPLPMAATAQYGQPQGYYAQGGGWDAPPAEFREAQRIGFHDGVIGAQKDYDHHRYPNVNNRDEFRHPHIEPALRGDYREGFKAGYDRAMNHLLHQR